jgi:hypothetical protein
VLFVCERHSHFAQHALTRTTRASEQKRDQAAQKRHFRRPCRELVAVGCGPGWGGGGGGGVGRLVWLRATPRWPASPPRPPGAGCSGWPQTRRVLGNGACAVHASTCPEPEEAEKRALGLFVERRGSRSRWRWRAAKRLAFALESV